MPFIAVAGLRNRPFDYVREHQTYEQAVEGLADAFEMLGRRKAKLQRDGYLEMESLNGAWCCRVGRLDTGVPLLEEGQGSKGTAGA